MTDYGDLYPELTEDGQEKAKELMDKFKEDFKKIAEGVLGELYTDTLMHIEGDSWTNFRSYIISYLRYYPHRKTGGDYNFKEIRQAIYKEYREEIIHDLNQDLVEENERLKSQLHRALEYNRTYSQEIAWQREKA